MSYLAVSLGKRKKLIFWHRKWELLQPVIEHVLPLRPQEGRSIESKSAMLMGCMSVMNWESKLLNMSCWGNNLLHNSWNSARDSAQLFNESVYTIFDMWHFQIVIVVGCTFPLDNLNRFIRLSNIIAKSSNKLLDPLFYIVYVATLVQLSKLYTIHLYLKYRIHFSSLNTHFTRPFNHSSIFWYVLK